MSEMLKLALFAIAAGSPFVVAQVPAVPTVPAPLPRSEVDARAAQVAYDTVLTGANQFNSGNVDECLLLYQSTLNALLPFLDHRPELVKLIGDKVTKSKGLTKSADKAFALREALDAIMGTQFTQKPLWDRLGGQPAVEAVVHDFVAATAANPKVNFTRDGKFKLDAAGIKKFEGQLVQMVSSATGGPMKYEGKDMKAAHAGMKISDDEFNAMLTDFVLALNKNKVPKAEMDELITIVSGTRADIVEPKK
jgi:hemoglobin